MELYTRIFRSPPWNESVTVTKARGRIGTLASKKRFIGFAAEIDGETIGYLFGFVVMSIYPLSRIYYLNELFIDPKFQKRGIGTRMVETLFEELLRRGIPCVVLLTQKSTPAEKCYNALGFATIPGLLFNNKIMMVRRLNKNGGDV